MDRIRELLDRLADESNPLTDEELAELDAGIRDEAQAEDTDLETLEALAEAADQVRAEQAARDEAAAQAEARRAELLDRISPPEPEEEPEPEAEPAAEANEPEPEPEPTPAEEPEEPAAEATEPEPIAAAAPPARRRQVPAALRPRPTATAEPEVAIIAGGDLRGISAGTEIRDLETLGRAFADKAASANGHHVVATFRQPDLPDGRTLRPDDAAGNGAKISAVVAAAMEGPEALTAAGGLCAPPAPRYEQLVVATARRPIRDSLVRFAGDRGGVVFNAPPTLANAGGAIGFWPESLDADPGAATKPCLTITCNEASTINVDAVTLCLQVGNFNRRTFPENFAAWFANAQAAHAREAEDRMWEAMCTASTAVTSGADLLGAARDILVHLARAAAGLRYRHRTARDQVVDVWLPEVVRDMMLADFTRQLPGDNAINVALAEIEGYFRDRFLNVTWSPDAGDQSFGVEAGGALQNWPTTIEAIVAFPGTFLFVDGGMLDFGTEIRDSTLIGTNDVRAFLETFEAVADVGVESFCLSMNVCPSGETAATADTSALCTSGS